LTQPGRDGLASLSPRLRRSPGPSPTSRSSVPPTHPQSHSRSAALDCTLVAAQARECERGGLFRLGTSNIFESHAQPIAVLRPWRRRGRCANLSRDRTLTGDDPEHGAPGETLVRPYDAKQHPTSGLLRQLHVTTPTFGTDCSPPQPRSPRSHSNAGCIRAVPHDRGQLSAYSVTAPTRCDRVPPPVTARREHHAPSQRHHGDDAHITSDSTLDCKGSGLSHHDQCETPRLQARHSEHRDPRSRSPAPRWRRRLRAA